MSIRKRVLVLLDDRPRVDMDIDEHRLFAQQTTLIKARTTIRTEYGAREYAKEWWVHNEAFEMSSIFIYRSIAAQTISGAIYDLERTAR